MSSKIEKNECAIIFSGGTDSTCVAALSASSYEKIHLLTYYDQSQKGKAKPKPSPNIQKLKSFFDQNTFISHILSTNDIVKRLSQTNYLKNLRHHGLLVLANCAYTSLSWHVRTIMYCRQKGLRHAFDGLTQEMTHLPGHMPLFIDAMKKLYSSYGITYDNPVIDWETPKNQQFEEKLIVNQHQYLLPFENEDVSRKTTGKYLFDLGFFSQPNIKGTELDRKMQQDCYPFVLYNIIAFWIYLQLEPYEAFELRVLRFVEDQLTTARAMIESKELTSSYIF